MNIVVLAIDPGITTGYTLARITDSLVKIRPMQHRHSELQFYEFLNAVEPDFIVCEDFEIRPNSPIGLELFSVRLIGITHLYAQQTAYVKAIYMQTAARGKGGHFKGTAHLKKAGVYVPGEPYHHSMDAMRHFMQWYHFGAGYKYWRTAQRVELVK